MPQNHAQTLRERTPMTPQRKRAWALATAAVVVAFVVVIILSTGGKTQLGCVHTYLPGAMGATSFDQCGAAARHTCATVRETDQFSQTEALEVADACRKGHLPVG